MYGIWPAYAIDNIRGHDNDEFSHVMLELAGTEQSAQNRHVAQERELVDIIIAVILYESGDGEALAAAKFNRGGGFAGLKCGDVKAGSTYGSRLRQRAYFRRHGKVDAIFGQHYRY